MIQAHALPDTSGILDLSGVRAVMEAMNGDGEETRIVGGAVRNFLMAAPIADIDMATTAAPQAVARRAKARGWKVVPTGIDHGTVTVVVNHMPFEITTLREDIKTDGRRAVVRFGRNFEADARRRDFTMNALSVDIHGTLHDYCGGREDIAARRVRFIGNAHQRIREDYLRILRFFRFEAVYGDSEPDRDGLLASIAEAGGLDQISAERIRGEFLKTQSGPNALRVLSSMVEAGILPRILAGVVDIGRWSRLSDSAPALERIAALAIQVREDADRLRERLKLSNAESRFLSDYAAVLEKLKGTAQPFEPDDIRRLVVDWPPQAVLCAFRATRGEPTPHINVDALRTLKRFASGEAAVPIFPLRGADITTRGVPMGKAVGTLLASAKDIWMEWGCPEELQTKEDLLFSLFEQIGPPEC